MVLFPPAKLNLGLHILGRRPDGFHALESIFLPLAWTDILEVVVDPKVPAGTMRTTFTGLDIPGAVEDNLVVRAHALLAQRHELPGLHLLLHKILPMGGGLGGGSADGTFALRAIHDACGLQLSQNILLELAAQLGSDCPFFVKNVPSLVTGRGEHVQPLDFALPLEGWWVVVVNPGIHISTAEAFSDITPNGDSMDWAQLATLPVASWGAVLRNDFEKGAMERHPSIGKCLQALRDHGAGYAQMTGSGSTVYGLFAEEPLAQSAALKLGAQYVGALG